MLLYIVRHGETDWNKAGKVQGRTDIPLNERGRYLAEATAEGMKDVRIDFCYTSPLIRAKETAQIILGEREIPLVEEKRIEEICFGKCEGMKFRGEITDPGSEAFQRFFTDTENYVPSEGAESISELYERTGCFLSEIADREDLKDSHILISTHGAAMTALLNRIKGNMQIKDFWKYKVPKNCVVSVVEIKGKDIIIKEEGLIYY